MVPAGNKAKRLSSVNHTTKTIHHHHHHHHTRDFDLGLLPVKSYVLHVHLIMRSHGIVCHIKNISPLL